MPSVTKILEAAKEVQAILDAEKDRMEGGVHLRLCDAALKVYKAAKVFKEGGAESEEEEEDNDDYEHGDATAAEVAADMILDVLRDPDNFADLVSGLHVHSLTKTRRPKACALATVHMLEMLDRHKRADQAKLRKWKKLFVSLDGQGRCGYILKQCWLDDDYRNEEDSDPREAVMRIMELMILDDADFRERLVLRGNVDAVNCLIRTTDHPALCSMAEALLAKLVPPDIMAVCD